MAAESSVVVELQHLHPSPQSAPPLPPQTSTSVVDKTLSSAANLVKLLPSGTVFIFQALSPSFTNKGQCYSSNRYLTSTLTLICSLSCLFFSIIDTLKCGDGKLYYGLATFRGFYVVNFDGSHEEKKQVLEGSNLKRLRLLALDYVHAVFSILVFLAVTFGDLNVQRCLFPDASAGQRELLVNLPLGALVMSSLVFLVFPTTRKGIGYSDHAEQ